MEKATVIFTDTYTTAQWAIGKLRKKPQKRIKILALTLSAQTALKEAKVDPFEYFSIAEFPENIFYTYEQTTPPRDNVSTQAKELITEIITKAEQLNILYNEYSIIRILELYYFSLFIDTLRIHRAFNNMINTWHPTTYYLHKDSNNLFAEYLTNHPTERKKIRYFKPKRNLKEWCKNIFFPHVSLLSKQWQRASMLTKVSAKKATGEIKNLLSEKRTPLTVFISFGENLSFYNRFFSMIAKKYNKINQIYIVSGKHTLKTLSLLNEHTVMYHHHQTILPKQTNQKIIRETEDFLKVFREKSLALEKSVWKKLPLHLRKLLFSHFKKITIEHAPKMIRELETAEYCITKLNLKLVITTSDPGPYALCWVYPAKEYNRETLVLLHGLFGGVEKANSVSKHYGVWGKITKEWFKKHFDKSEDTLHEIGFQRLDSFLREKKTFWQQPSKPTKIKTPTTIGLLLSLYTHTQPDPYVARFVTQIMEQFASFSDQYIFRIRTHPYQNIDTKAIQETYRIRVKHEIAESIEDFVVKCDIIVSISTSAILWPLLYGKPLIHTKVSWGKGTYPLSKYKAAWMPKNPAQLFSLIEKLRNDPIFAYSLRPGQRKFLEGILGPLDGKSSKRLATLINHLVPSP